MARDYTWIDESVEHSDSDCARAAALAKKWSALHSARENRQFARMANIDDGRDYPEFEDEDDERDFHRMQAEREAERDLELELIEDKLSAIGARMMRPYEHWNEEERFMEYQETRYDNEGY